MRPAVMALLLVACLQVPRASPAELRFHHLHVSVPDPAAASREAAARLNGTRTILQGHGLSVRAGAEYLVFDRDDVDAQRARSDAAGHAAQHAAVYRSAIEWIADLGLKVEPVDFRNVAVRDATPSAPIGKIAFSSSDPARVLEALAARGTLPVERTEDISRFRLSNELTLEIIPETDRPDAFWCPMHPDVRAPSAGKCGICSMDLVPIPPPRIGEYRVDVTTAPGARGRGIASIRMRVVDPETGEPIGRFLDVHEKPFHLFIVSRDLEYFAHVHPDVQEDGTLVVRHALAEGRYVLIADFLPAAGTPQMVQKEIVTPGYVGPLFVPAAPLVPTPPEQVVDGLRIRLDVEAAAALRRSVFRFVVLDAGSGAPATDLEPYLGAAGHLLIVDADLTHAIHAHPESRSSGDASLTFDPVLPIAGRYKLWVQFQRKGRVVTAPFVIEIPGASP